jgi:hypothetical protein
MKLTIGIVGLPNVGKSTLFNALTKKSVSAENYPFCTIDPSVGIVAVPDERLGRLTDFSKSAKTIPAIVEFVDIAGLVKGASKGEGLGNKFLSHIRETDAILEVVRIFEDDKIIHVEGKIDPLGDIGVINTELVLADMETVAKRLANIMKDVKRGDKLAIAEEALLQKVYKFLDSGALVSSHTFAPEEYTILRHLHFITAKPFLYVLNKKAGSRNLDELNDERYQKLIEFFKLGGEASKYVVVDAKIEEELKDFEGEEKETLRRELNGGDDDGINNLIREGYKLLGLQTYFTTGEDETRAWTVKVGATAPEAGAAIHNDFKDRFIRAEIIHCDELLKAGSYAEARTKGLVRTEGKEYVVKDGDVIEFKV